jgi:hypothetical protein
VSATTTATGIHCAILRMIRTRTSIAATIPSYPFPPTSCSATTTSTRVRPQGARDVTALASTTITTVACRRILTNPTSPSTTAASLVRSAHTKKIDSTLIAVTTASGTGTVGGTTTICRNSESSRCLASGSYRSTSAHGHCR